MALCALSGDEQRILFVQLCNVLEPRIAVYLSSASHELWELTPALREQLRAGHEAAAALCLHLVEDGQVEDGQDSDDDEAYRYDEPYDSDDDDYFSDPLQGLGRRIKAGIQSCKQLREARQVAAGSYDKGLSPISLGLLGTLGSVLPALEQLTLTGSAAATSPDGVQRLAAGLGAGALPAVTNLIIFGLHVGNGGASALAASLGRGALPRLTRLEVGNAAIGDAGLVALAPALRRLPALQTLLLLNNQAQHPKVVDE